MPFRLPLLVVVVAVLLVACRSDPPTAPRVPDAPVALGGTRVPRPILADEAPAAPVARVEIVPAFAHIVYTNGEPVEREFTAIAYDADGNVLAGRRVVWTDELGWNPPIAEPQVLSSSSVRVSLPYPNTAAPTRWPAEECVLEWRGLRATIDGVSALAPICGAPHVEVSSDRASGPTPVSGDTILLGAGQQCRVYARASGGNDSYDYWWRLDGVPVGEGPVLTLDTGAAAATHTLVLYVRDEGHDIGPVRELTFTLRFDGSHDAALDC